MYNSRGFRTWNAYGHPSGLGNTTDRTSGRASTSERGSDKYGQHRTGKSAGQHDGFACTTTRSDGTTERFSEEQVVAFSTTSSMTDRTNSSPASSRVRILAESARGMRLRLMPMGCSVHLRRFALWFLPLGHGQDIGMRPGELNLWMRPLAPPNCSTEEPAFAFRGAAGAGL